MTLWIWPKAYREKVGVDDYAHHPIGTGPYKIARVDGVTQIDLERYAGYYADSPKGKPAIQKIRTNTTIGDSTGSSDGMIISRIAAMVSMSTALA